MGIFISIVWIVLIFLVLWISYKYLLTAPENPWKKAGIPEVSTWDSYSAFVKFFVSPIPVEVLRNYKKYGKLYGSSLFGSLALSVADPELIRNILVKDFQHFTDRIKFTDTGDPILDNAMTVVRGEKWKRIRNITSPTFSTGKIKKMTSIILDCVETLEKNFDKDAALKKPSDVKKLIGAFTMDAIASTAFSTKIDSHNDPDNPFYKAASKIFDRWIQFRNMMIIILNSLLTSLRLKPIRMRFFELFENVARDIIEERKKSGQKRNDFLQLMLDASASSNSSPGMNTVDDKNDDFSQKSQFDEKTLAENNQVKDDVSTQKEHKGLNQEEIIAQCITFWLGGLETVSSIISFALYEIALNDDVQDELVDEINEVLRLNQNELTYESVQTLKYLENVVSETLRKYPPGFILARVALRDYKANDTNLIIPKDASVEIPVYAIHHDPDYFPDPDKFDPNRFTVEEKARRDPYVYLPFGAGPRNCVAMRFALTEVKLCLAYLLNRFRFCRCSKTQVPLTFPLGQLQLIAKDIFLILERRNNATS